MGAEDESVKAAATVRRVIQKVRVATPENFDQLEAELLEVLESKLGELGDQFEKVQEEADKGLVLGRKRVEQIMKKREEEEANAERPKELVQELKDMIAAFEEKTHEFKAAACLEGGEELGSDDVAAVESAASDFEAQAQEFSKTFAAFLKTNGPAVQAPSVPTSIKTAFQQSVPKGTVTQTAARSAIAQAKAAVAKVVAAAKKERLEQAKLELKERIKDAAAPVTAAEQAVEKAEKQVEPFVKLTNKSVDEMLALAAEVDEAIKAAQEAVSNARGQVSTPDSDVDETIRAELKAWLAAEAKRPEMRLGQLDRRLARAVNLVKRYRRDVNQSRNVELIKEMKPQLLEKAKAAAASPEIVTAVDAAIKEAEKQVEPFSRSAKLSADEMAALADKAAEALDVAKTSMAEARHELRPIDETLDDDLKKELNEAVAPEVRKPEMRLNQMERRLTRASNLLTTFRVEVSKKAAAKLGTVRAMALRVISHNRQTKGATHEELFSQIDVDSNGMIDEAEFLSFFDRADRPEGETTEIPADDLKALFASYIREGPGTVTKDAFMELACAYMKVVKPTTITAELGVAGSKALRQLKIGEMLQVLEGPAKDGSVGLSRVKVQSVSVKGSTPGWVTVASNAGTVFLKECSAIEITAAKK